MSLGALLIITSLFSKPAIAASASIDALLPNTRDQGSSGDCYAQTASDLETVYLEHAHKIKDKTEFVSPLATAVCSKKDSLKADLSDAKVEHELTLSKDKMDVYLQRLNQLASELKQSSLSESSLKSKQNEFSQLCKWTSPGSLHDCRVSHGLSDALPGESDASESIIAGGDISNAIQNSVQNCGVCLEKDFNSAQDIEFLTRTEQALDNYAHPDEDGTSSSCASPQFPLDKKGEKTLNTAFKNLLKGKLSDHPAFAVMKKKCKRKNSLSQEISRNTLNKDLSQMNASDASGQISTLLKKGLPVGIAYNGQIFQNSNPVDRTANHASTVIGQETRNNELYFVVRNSWGESACTQKKAALKVPQFDCDNQGNFIVKASDLMAVTTQATWISEDQK